MAEYGEEWDRDDYGDDDGDNSANSLHDSEDFNDLHDDMKKQESNDSEMEQEDDSDEESNGLNNSRQQYVDLLDDQLRFPVANQLKITNPYISKYEKAIIIGKRAEQISQNSPIYADAKLEQLKQMDPLKIAELEYEQNRIPFIIRRYLPNGQFQDWKIQQLQR